MFFPSSNCCFSRYATIMCDIPTIKVLKIAKIIDRVFKKGLGTSSFNSVSLKISTRMTIPHNFRNLKLPLIKHSGKNKQKSVRQVFQKTGKCRIFAISKIARILSYRFFRNFGFRRVSTLLIICENSIMGRTVGCREI